MALSKIRRILIAIVGFLLLVDVLLLGVAWMGSATTEAETNDVVAWAASAEAGQAAAAELKAAGREVSISEADRDVRVPNGFRLVKTGQLYVQPYYRTLHEANKPVRILGEGAEAEVQYGEPLPERAKAVELARQVQKQHGIVFDVHESFRFVKKKAYRLVVSGLDEKATAEVFKYFEGKNMEPGVHAPASKQSGEPG